jgi:hypothetical protein
MNPGTLVKPISDPGNTGMEDKNLFDSDDAVVTGWVENPYWQYLSGMKYFSHELPCNSSSMTRWRKRIGESGAEKLLRKTIEAGLKLKVIKKER